MRQKMIPLFIVALMLGLSACGTPSGTGETAPVDETEPEITVYSGDTVTTVSSMSWQGIDPWEVSFSGEDSAALTDLLRGLDYDRDAVCNCSPEYYVDTEFGTGYGVNLTESYVKYDGGQATLTAEQTELIQEILDRQTAQLESAVSGTVRWEYTPTMSSRYPAMALFFSVPGQEVQAACNNGALIDFDHFDSVSQSYPQGKSLTAECGGTLYWAPWDEETGGTAAEAEVTFTIVDGTGAVLHEGRIVIVWEEKTEFGEIYSAVLEEGTGLILMQNAYQGGGIVTEWRNGVTHRHAAETAWVEWVDSIIEEESVDIDGGFG